MQLLHFKNQNYILQAAQLQLILSIGKDASSLKSMESHSHSPCECWPLMREKHYSSIWKHKEIAAPGRSM